MHGYPVKIIELVNFAENKGILIIEDCSCKLMISGRRFLLNASIVDRIFTNFSKGCERFKRYGKVFKLLRKSQVSASPFYCARTKLRIGYIWYAQRIEK